jgi:hypothetical protein
LFVCLFRQLTPGIQPEFFPAAWAGVLRLASVACLWTKLRVFVLGLCKKIEAKLKKAFLFIYQKQPEKINSAIAISNIESKF